MATLRPDFHLRRNQQGPRQMELLFHAERPGVQPRAGVGCRSNRKAVSKLTPMRKRSS